MKSNTTAYRAKKSLGQNFLHNNNVIEKIIRQAHILPKDFVVEIGPGLGALTTKILPIVGKLNVIEYDHNIIPILQKNCLDLGELIVHHHDILKYNLSNLITEEQQKIKLIGNLPYNISSPLIFHLLNYAQHIQNMHFMLQKEMVQRICAAPDNKNYGRLSIMIQYFCQTEALFIVPPTAFTPAPKVDSQIIRLTPYENPPHLAKNFDLFAQIVKAAFAQRRKTLRNTLKQLVNSETLEKAGINPSARAETITLESFVKLSNIVEDL
jgi:16S rRNA (adenine1518-N6/adenine1519-N6)-dimethyltransferase